MKRKTHSVISFIFGFLLIAALGSIPNSTSHFGFGDIANAAKGARKKTRRPASAKISKRAKKAIAVNYKAAKRLDHNIKHVTVYSDQAEVERGTKVRVKTGANWYVFDRLHNNIRKDSVRLGASASGKVAIEQVTIETTYTRIDLPKDIDKKLKNLRLHYSNLLDERQTRLRAQDHLKFLKTLSFNAPFDKNSRANTYRPFEASITTVSRALASVTSETRSKEKALKRVDDRIDKLKDQIDLIERQIKPVTQKSKQAWTNNVYVLLKSEGKQLVNLDLKYKIDRAKWYPRYDVRSTLNRKEGTADVKLIVGGLVEQHTGEDWQNVDLSLSTLSPVPLVLPKMDRWVFSERRVEKVMPESKRISRPGGYGYGGGRGSNAGMANAPAPSKKMKAKLDRYRSSDEPADDFAEYDYDEEQVSSSEQMIGEDELQEGLVGKSELKPKRAARMKDQRVRVQGMVSAKNGAASSSSPQFMANDRSNVSYGKWFPIRPLQEIFPAFYKVEREISSLAGVHSTKRKAHQTKNRRVYSKKSYGDSKLPAVQANGRNMEYHTPFSVTLKNDAPALKIPLHSQLLKGNLSYLAIPKQDKRVFLRAKTTNTTDAPILGGPAQIFMDGDLVSRTDLNTVNEDGFFEIDLGVDPNVETERIVKKKSDTTGLISKDHQTEVKVTLNVKNNHGFPIHLELKDHYPKSQSEDIEIELVKVTPQTKLTKHGLITWKNKVPANKKQTFEFTYKVKHPENYLVSEFN